MTRQLGDATLGLASEVGLPPLEGGDAPVLSYPAFAPDEALRLVPTAAGDAPLETWALGLDIYVPQPAGTFVSLLQTGTGDGELFLRDNGDGTAGLGIAGVYDGAVAFDAWTRIVVSYTREGDATVLRKYVDGTLVGTQTLDADPRWAVDPATGLRVFADNDGETAAGAASSVFFSTDVPEPADVAALLATIPNASAAGFFAAAPTAAAIELDFAGEDLAPRYGAAEVVLEGFGFRTPVQLNDSAIALATQFGIEGPDGADIAVLDYAAYTPEEGVRVELPSFGPDLTSYTAVWDLRLDALPGFQALLQTDPGQEGDGELFVRADGGIGINGDYDGAVLTDTWRRIAITVEDLGDGTAQLSKYLDGVFLDDQTVSTDRFALSAQTGFLLLSDNDGETSTGYLSHFGLTDAVLDAAAIAALGGADGAGPFEAQGQAGQPLTLSFDSHWRPFDNQTAQIFASYDGGAAVEIFRYDSSNTDDQAQRNERVSVDFLAPGDASDVALSFRYSEADNDWYWALDDLELTTADGTVLLSEGFDGLTGALQQAVDEATDAIGWTHETPEGWDRSVADTTPQGTTEWRGWSFVTPEFWTTSAPGQAREEFERGDGVIAVADGDEWDDFNGGAAGQPDSFDTTLTTPRIALAGSEAQSAAGDEAQTYQIGFDDYAAQVEFGFEAVEVIDLEAEMPIQDNIADLLLADTGAAVEIDLAAAFGEGASDFAVTAADGSVVAAEIAGSTLTLSGLALGHSDITVTAQGPGGTALEENFRAIVAGENAYVFAIMPDTQDYTSNPGIAESFGNMSDWLLAQQESLAIQHMIHVGDIVQFGAVNQWEIAEEAIERLDGALSYTLAIGNHDQQRPGFSSAFSFETDVDTYFTPEQVGATEAQGGGTYDGFDVGEDTFGNGDSYADSIRNHYTTLTTPDGTDWLIMSLEFGMPDDVLRWASEVIEDHLDHQVIIDTHSWNGGDGRVTPTTEPLTTDNDGWGYAIRDNPRGINGGEDAWRELASKYPNIAFTFNGHNFMGGAETVVSYAAGGSPVHQMFVNYQNGAWAGVEGIGTNGGNGALRLVVIDPDNDRFTTHTKLVELDSYYDAFPDHEEVFEGVRFDTPEEIAIAKAGETQIVAGDGIAAEVTLDPTATLGDLTGARFEWLAADGEKLGETDGAALQTLLPAGTNRVTLQVTDAAGNVSTDDTVVIVEAPGALLTETFDDGDLTGWQAPAPDLGELTELGTDIGFALPAIDGGAAQIPLKLSFDSHWRPFDAQTGTVLARFDGGPAVEVLRYDSTTTDDTAQRNETVTLDFLAPASAETVDFIWRYDDADNDWYWAIDNIALTAPAAAALTEIWSEDFDGLADQLDAAADEAIAPEILGWTHTPPEGFTREVDPNTPPGTTEWRGWSFVTPEFWVAADDQARSEFTKGAGVIAVADGDEWDDFNGGSDGGDDLNTLFRTGAIDVSDQTAAGAAMLSFAFDSHWRPFDAQTGVVSVSVDGGAAVELLRLDSTTTNDLDNRDRAYALDFEVAQGAQSVEVTFEYLTADNDWFWAVDNLSLSVVAPSVLLSEDFDGLAPALQPAVDETAPADLLGWTHDAPEGWSRSVDPDTPQGTTEWRGWSFVTPAFWVNADTQARGEFTKGTGVIAVADGDEWDDFNGGASGTPDSLDTSLGTPAVSLLPVGGGQAAGSAAGIVRVDALAGDEALLVSPEGSGEINDYTLIFDVLASETDTTFSALYQTDVANTGDAEVYLRNDGETASIGILGDYDGALAYGDWGRIALVLETDEAGQQTLSKYLDGVFLDDQVVDTDVSDGSRWTLDLDAGFLLFSEPNGFTSEIYANALHVTPEALDGAAIAALGGVDVDGPVAETATEGAVQFNFDDALDSRDYGDAGLEAVSLGGGDAGSYLLKGSIFGNPDGVGEAALYQQSNGADEVLIWAGEGAADWSNYVFDMVVEPADNDTIGAVFYYADEGNHYRLTLDQQNDLRTLVRVQDGEETELAVETASYRHYAPQDLRIAVADGTITITLDDEILFGGPVEDAAPLTGGSVGVLAQGMDRAIFDNIAVNPVTLAAKAVTQAPDGRWAADLDGDGSVEVALSAAASLSAAGIARIDWLVDGEVVAEGETATLDLAPGKTTVTLKITDADGAMAEDQLTLAVAGQDAVLVADDFADGDFDGWTIVDEGAEQAPSDWQVVDGALVQLSDLQSPQQGLGSTAFSQGGDGPFLLRDGTYALWDEDGALDWTDYAISAKLTPQDNDGIGFLFRYSDAENYYKLEADAETGLVMLTRHLEGRETLLARGYNSYTPGEAQHWRIEVEGGVITPYIDGKAVFGTVIEDRTLESGTVGLYSWGSEGIGFDDVVVHDFSTPDTLDPLAGALVQNGTDGRDRLTGTAGEVDAFVFTPEDTDFFSRDRVEAFEAGDLIDLRSFGFAEIAEGRDFPLDDGTLQIVDYAGRFTGLWGATEAGELSLRVVGDLDDVRDGLLI